MKPIAPNVLIQDRYLIVHLIGKGGMGEVYLAVDQRLGSAVALKRTFFSDDVNLATAFEREARILANLRHPILPKVSDHFVDGENQFLVMEHITGDDLSKRLEKTSQPFPLSWVLFWADQLLDALHYLHTHEPPIIHRDIKPQNLKLTNDNHIVLLDFGLSKNSVGETRTSSTGSVVGYTPHYAPMEQIRGTGTNAQSDLYSLSATIYQLLTNNVPPDALTRADSLLSGLPDPIKPINEMNKEVTAEVSEVILKGMDIRQESRHESARKMQKNLRDAYSRLQSSMSAQTVAFNLNDQQVAVENQSLQPDPPFESPINPEPQIQQSSGELKYNSLSEKNENSYPAEVKPADQNFDATIKFDSQISDSEIKPSDIKTEVLLGGDFPAIKAAQEGREIPLDDDFSEAQSVNPDNDFNSQEVDFIEEVDFDEAEEDFSTTGNFPDNKNFSPDATIPVMSFKENENGFNDEEDAFAGVGGNGETAFFSNIEVEDESGTGATFIPDRAELEREEEVKPEPIVTPVIKEKESSGGKKFAIIGGILAVVLMLLGGVGGLAWYFIQNSSSVDNATPLPTPEVTVEITPSIEPTPDQPVLIDNTNSGNENTNLNTNSQPVETTPTPVGTTTTPTVRPNVTATPTPKTPTPKTPTPKTPTPKTPTPKTPTPTIIPRIIQ
jgi:serine/threonine protein kinase